MTQDPYDVPLVRSVLHATDFSDASANAFAYALAISLIRRTKLTLLHAGKSHLAADEWTKFPGVRATLERWGLLDPGSDRSAVFNEFAVRVKKVGVKQRNPVTAIVRYLEEDPCDLLVLATEAREGLPRWIESSVAEGAAEKSSTRTLFVPDTGRGFVSKDTGVISLRRILVPVERAYSPAAALEFACRIARLIRASETETVDVELLHVGTAKSTPAVTYPDVPYCDFSYVHREGDVVEEILAVAREREIDLILMTTKGRHGVLDALRGSTTQQVLRRSPCPLLAIPVD